MSHTTAVVSRLALRELWISFRLLLLLAAYVAAGAAVALLPAPLSTTLVRLAVGLAVAIVVGAAVAAWSLSRERELGRAAWLATHAVPRASILLGWFVPLGAVSVIGLAASGMLGWLAASASIARFGPFVFGVTVATIATLALAMLALGLVLGVLLRPFPAVVATAVICALFLAAPWLVVPTLVLPIEALARLTDLTRPVATSVQGAGAGLAASGVLLLAGRSAFERVDL